MRYIYAVPPENVTQNWYELFQINDDGVMHPIALIRSEHAAENITKILNDNYMDQQLKQMTKGI